MIHLDVHRSVNGSDDSLAFAAVVFVTFFDRLGFPIGPINRIFKDGQGKDVVETGVGVVATTQDDAGVTTFQIRYGDIILTSVRPKYFISLVGNGQCVRPSCIIRKEKKSNKIK